MPDVKVISFLSTVYAAEKQRENKRMKPKMDLSLLSPCTDSELGGRKGELMVGSH